MTDWKDIEDELPIDGKKVWVINIEPDLTDFSFFDTGKRRKKLSIYDAFFERARGWVYYNQECSPNSHVKFWSYRDKEIMYLKGTDYDAG